MIYVCCREAERLAAEERIGQKFKLKGITDNLEDATEMIVVGTPNQRMIDEIKRAIWQEKKVRYEDNVYVQQKIVESLLGESLEEELELDLDKYLGIELE